MKAENTLQIMMDFNGDLFYTRQKCLDHLFLTIGNGYEWQDGELIEKEEDERIKRYKLVKDIEHAEPDQFQYEIGMMKERGLEIYEKTTMITNPENAKKLNLKWYPLSEDFSYICNYPDDIKPDWKALIDETKAMLEADGIVVPENNGYSYEDGE